MKKTNIPEGEEQNISDPNEEEEQRYPDTEEIPMEEPNPDLDEIEPEEEDDVHMDPYQPGKQNPDEAGTI
ncbi:hypothetical protein [Sphingobacterium sp. T2]|uniref:hypothetical protein n=1 Tax=Sphingobacterium sp. T2 TaxID=1590596 RepID=UPI00057BCBB6|nr:hypothetical protein [Sphingobacterium sp. T2]